MTLTIQELRLVVEDLAFVLPGLRVRKVFDQGPDKVALDLGRQGFLVLSGAPRTGRIHLSDEIQKRGRCSALCALLRKYLTGAPIVDLSVWPDDRVVELGFGRPVTLLLFVYGKGYALLDAERRLLGASASCPLSIGEAVEAPARSLSASQDKGGGLDARSASKAGASAAGGVRFRGQGALLHRQIEAAYRLAEETLLFEGALRRLSKELGARKKKLLRLKRRLEEDLGRQRTAEDKQRMADLLLSSGVSPERGVDHVVVSNWFQDGRETSIPLDPRYSIFENAQRLYKDARRDRRAAAMAGDRLQGVDVELEKIEEFLCGLEGAETLGDVTAIEEKLRDILGPGKLQRKGPGRSNRDGKPKRGRVDAPGRSFVSASGLEIRVGGGAQENHRLTFHWARGRDMWFHVAGRPGPHVVVRTDHKGGLDSETLLDAATLALFYVKKNRQAEGEVLYQRCKYLRPVKGSPGRVVTAGAKTIFLKLEAGRLTRLLSQRG